MSRSDHPHFFSPDDVNALIPRLEECFQNFWEFRQKAQDILEELRKRARDPQSYLPQEVAHCQMRQSQAHFLLEQAKHEMDGILEMGCLIKDLEIGLVDFPHALEMEGEEIYLCWKYGEKKVRFWHEIHEGFSARKPIPRKVPHS